MMHDNPGSFIESLGIDKTIVCIHSSMRSFKPRIEASTIIQAFLDRDSTVLVPSFSYFHEVSPPADDRPQANGIDYDDSDINPVSTHSFYHQSDNDLSVRDMGSFPAALLTMKKRERGDHPLNSFAAIGDHAEDLVRGQTWEDVYSPLRKLVEADGYLLLMGTDLTSLTFIHYAEQVAGRNLFIRWARDREGAIQRVRVGSCSRAFNNLQLSIDHLRKDVQFRRSRCQLLPAKQTLDAFVSAIRSNPGITQCKDSMCLRCHSAVHGGPEA